MDKPLLICGLSAGGDVDIGAIDRRTNLQNFGSFFFKSNVVLIFL